jgi:hypothetical protein
VSDYLAGKHLLLPEGDLIFFRRDANTRSPTSLVTWVSENSKFPNATERKIDNTGCNIARGPVRARLFNTPNDWVVSLQGQSVDKDACGSARNGNNIALYVADPSSEKPGAAPGSLNFKFLSEVQITVADVNRDGYDEVIVSDREKLFIITAVDTENPIQGVKIGFSMALPTVGDFYPFSHAHGMVGVGDFNGDGAIDLVVPVLQQPNLYGPRADWQLFVIRVCPEAGFVLFNTSATPGSKITCKAAFETHAIPLSAHYDVGALKLPDRATPFHGPTGYNAGIPPRVVAGDFLGRGPNQPSQLFVEIIESHVIFGGHPPGYVIDGYRRVYRLFDFDADLQPRKVSESLQDYPQSLSSFPNGDFDYSRYNDILLKGNLAGGLGPYSDRDWVILGGPDYNPSNGLSGYSFSIKVFDHSGTVLATTGASIPNVHTGFPYVPVYGMAIDRFDTRQANGEISLSQQIAILYKQHGVTGWSRGLWSVQPDLTIDGSVDASVTELDIGTLAYPGFDWEQGGLFTADTQGRSLLLGAPVKGVMERHYQPDVVLSIPPMHIDYIRDASGHGPQVINFTVVPSGPSKPFNTQYAFTSAGSNKGEYSHTIDTSTSIGLSYETKVVWGDEKANNTTATFKAAAKGAVETNWNTKNSHYQTKTVSLDATTGFADHLFFSVSRQNFWYYPLLGKRCPAINPQCAVEEKQQQAIIISGPDMIESHDADVTFLEWFQPVNEPGNIFSYPWDLDQMKLVNADLNTLTHENWSLTDTSTIAARTDWKQGGDTGETTGTVGKWQADVSASLSGQMFVPGMLAFSMKGQVDVSHSGAVKTVNTDTVVLDASTGIIVNKPGFRSEVANKYYYYFASYIFGKNPLDISLLQPHLKQKNGQPVTQQFFGPLTVAYAADPFHSSGVAPWWRHAYDKPDIGLNHPARWDWNPDTKTATFNKPTNPPTPKSIMTDPFYYMKGLYTFAASDDPSAPVALASATAGDLLTLQARVYNFSVADMPAGSAAKARLYGQIYDPAKGILSGDAFLIGETSIGAIPGFKSDSNRGTLPNWKLASTTFDTTNYAGKLLVFWVVVWGQDAQGKLMQELEGHGLKQDPAHLSFKQISEVPIEDYTNNIGMHHSHTPFFVRPKTNANAAVTTVFVAGDVTQLHANDIRVDAAPVRHPGERSDITVTIHNTSGGALSFEPIAIYDGDPDHGGKLIDYQEMPYVNAGGTYTLRSSLVPQTSGLHNIFVRIGRQGNAAQGFGVASLHVP